MIQIHHLDKWAYCNLDLIEETLEKKNKALVLIAGASSSGKSHCASYLSRLLKMNGHESTVISLDNYNIGLSGIIPNKVNLNFFDSSLPNMEEIRKEIKDIIYDVDFDEKYSEPVLEVIRRRLSALVDRSVMDKFLSALNEEWRRVNFDETSVYDLKEASADISSLLEGKKIKRKEYSKIFSERVPTDDYIDGSKVDVIIVEGIYALSDDLLNSLQDKGNIAKNFIEGNAKSLFLRRIIRDAKSSSASTSFTTKLYFTSILKSYQETIYPSRLSSDIILYNDMAFSEIRQGDLYTNKETLDVKDEKKLDDLIDKCDVISLEHQKDIYFSCPEEKADSKVNNILRLREISKDQGKTYIPSSLVHKGKNKLRKDGKLIRPINVIIKEGEFFTVWDSEYDCLKDYLSAGFYIGPVKFKTKYRLVYKGQKITVNRIKGDSSSVELVEPYNKDSIKEICEILDARMVEGI